MLWIIFGCILCCIVCFLLGVAIGKAISPDNDDSIAAYNKGYVDGSQDMRVLMYKGRKLDLMFTVFEDFDNSRKQ